MSDNSTIPNIKDRISDWITIREAVKVFNGFNGKNIRKCDIYRYALQGKIRLSIYFQSPVILRRIKSSNHKLKLTPINKSFTTRLCMLDPNTLLNGNDLTFSTDGEYIFPVQRVIDTTLLGYEYVLIQRLLAQSLKIPPPESGANKNNYGITVSICGGIFQIFEKTTWQERIKQQVRRLPEDIASDIYETMLRYDLERESHKYYFPVHELPKDACFVIRQTEFKKLVGMPVEKNFLHPTSARISTPLSRLFWLACKHNEAISPLIRQPYKLLSIFEQWASDDGITDRFSGDTLKTALERGSPTAVSASKR
ncbi:MULTISPECIES: hypothetical protein [unclassified Brenneria]|uniref:hypothetical protein n=1 Tax=unclassified Brenneria TaxID=2634434 RepID=UPI001554281B|nr:hypothetical protein [Brenneria sp. hezel4-2-4]MEE3649875.1 hypothetical protein [Brenneria sp. HEZEL_4_2_4]NPC99834.1 hypothetical protein [Brenneria sp. hezel4-2-4]